MSPRRPSRSRFQHGHGVHRKIAGRNIGLTWYDHPGEALRQIGKGEAFDAGDVVDALGTGNLYGIGVNQNEGVIVARAREHDSIRPGAAVDRTGPRPAGQRIVVAAAIEDIVAVTSSSVSNPAPPSNVSVPVSRLSRLLPLNEPLPVPPGPPLGIILSCNDKLNNPKLKPSECGESNACREITSLNLYSLSAGYRLVGAHSRLA